MANVKELLRTEENGTISFGDYSLDTKTKLSDFKFEDNTYKVKTFKEITRLEKNGGVVYESVPGSAVHDYKETERQIAFVVEAVDDIHITLEVEPEKEYKVFVDDTNICVRNPASRPMTSTKKMRSWLVAVSRILSTHSTMVLSAVS